MAKPKIKSDGRTITVRVPIAIRKRGGRKVVLAPDGTQTDPNMLHCQQPDNAMVKALARAFRWREMLENGVYATIKEIAEVEKIAETYVGRILRLSLLAPDVVEAIMTGRQLPDVTLDLFVRSFPMEWEYQRDILSRGARPSV